MTEPSSKELARLIGEMAAAVRQDQLDTAQALVPRLQQGIAGLKDVADLPPASHKLLKEACVALAQKKDEVGTKIVANRRKKKVGKTFHAYRERGPGGRIDRSA